jgi:hypothetical protein
MVRLGGIEPPTSGSTIQRSNQLSYNRTRAFDQVKRVIGANVRLFKSAAAP